MIIIIVVNILDFDLNLLVVFRAVAEHHSVTAAARALGRTQPAVSNAMARLRDALGDPLFVRVGQRMEPTARAVELAPAVDAALRMVECAVQPAASFDPAHAERQFRVVTTDYTTFVLVPALMHAIGQIAPNVTLRFVSSESKARDLQMLSEGAADLALGGYDSRLASLRRRRLLSERFVIVARQGHPGVERGRLSLRDLAEYPHAMQSARGDAHGMLDTLLERKGLTRHVALTMPHFPSLALAVARSDMLALLPRRIAQRMSATCPLTLASVPIRLPTFWTSLWWDHRHDPDPAHRWFREQIATTSRELDERRTTR